MSALYLAVSWDLSWIIRLYAFLKGAAYIVRRCSLTDPAGEASVERGRSGKVPVERGRSGKVPVERGRSGKVSVERGRSGKVPVERGRSGKVPVERGRSGKVSVERGGSGKVPVERDQGELGGLDFQHNRKEVDISGLCRHK